MTYSIIMYEAIGYGLTDVWFLEQLAQAEREGATQINIRLSGPGGDVKHGLGIINALDRCTIPYHTYNDGLVASMTANIWAKGQKRYMAEGSVIMIHAVSAGVYGQMKASDLRDLAETIDKFTSACLPVWNNVYQTQSDGLTFQQRFFDNGKDHYLLRNEAEAMFQIEKEAPKVENAPKTKQVAQKKYQQFVAQLSDKTISINENDKNDMTENEVKALIETHFAATNKANADILAQKEAEITALKAKKDAKIAELQAKLDNYVPAPQGGTVPTAGKVVMTTAQLKAHKEMEALAAEIGYVAILPQPQA